MKKLILRLLPYQRPYMAATDSPTRTGAFGRGGRHGSMAATCAQSGLGRRSGATPFFFLLFFFWGGVPAVPDSQGVHGDAEPPCSPARRWKQGVGAARDVRRATLGPARAPLQRHRQCHPGRT